MPPKTNRTADELARLFDQYLENKASYRTYKEANIRSEFLDRLFRILGWDVSNDRGLPPSQREVVVEPSLENEDHKRAPDYAFIYDRKEIFFVEAKAAHVTIKNDRSAAFQARSYGWTARHPLVVLTNFEEIAVYDCRYEPQPDDDPGRARQDYFSLEEHGPVQVADFLRARFAKWAVANGAFSELVFQYERKKKGTKPVDEAFLEEIGSWRKILAEEIWRQNRLSKPELNQAIQLMIDRLVFLRICEDRDIEEFYTLQRVKDGGKSLDTESILARLKQVFHAADDRYDSGLFHFNPKEGNPESVDRVTPGLAVSDEVLRKIISRLYFPESPYAFRKLPADILGQVYEQFLGRVVEIRDGAIVIEEKPEVKKANGVVYTPDHIVREIVRHALGGALSRKTPETLGPLAVLDPACGSGTFLIEAFQVLHDWHLDHYAKGPRKFLKAGKLDAAGEGARLSLKEKKRILLSHVFGVDIDPQAVEVTKLSLLLKVLEGESNVTIRNELKFSAMRALPDLDENIKCGNSLIDSKYYELHPQALVDPKAPQPNSPFDWEKGFPQVVGSAGTGFDVVVGNPPYIDLQTMKKWAKTDVNYYQRVYESSGESNPDIYVAFVERSLQLLRPGGQLGFIVPHKFFTAKYGAPLRRLLSRGRHVDRIVHFGSLKVFPRRSVYPCLLFLRKEPLGEFKFTKVLKLSRWKRLGEGLHGTLPATLLSGAEWNIVVGPSGPIFYRLQRLLDKLSGAGDIFVGLQTSADPVFVFTQFTAENERTLKVFSDSLQAFVSIERDLLKAVVRSGAENIGRYKGVANAVVLFPYEKTSNGYAPIPRERLEKSHPLAWEYLSKHKKILEEREEGKFAGEAWYQLYPKNLDEWDGQKVMIPYMVRQLSAFFDGNGGKFFVNVTTGGFGLRSNGRYGSSKFLTALLNSDLLSWFASKLGSDFQSGYMGVNKQFLDQVPLPSEETLSKHSADCVELEKLVDSLQSLHEMLVGERASHARSTLQRKIEAAQNRVNQLVFELYGIGISEVTLIEQDLAETERLRAGDESETEIYQSPLAQD